MCLADRTARSLHTRQRPVLGHVREQRVELADRERTLTRGTSFDDRR
jgi:hypothetical protein